MAKRNVSVNYGGMGWTVTQYLQLFVCTIRYPWGLKAYESQSIPKERRMLLAHSLTCALSYECPVAFGQFGKQKQG